MKIWQKLILVIFINLVAIVGLGAMSYVGIQTINARFDELVRLPIPSILRLSNMTEALILSVEEAHSYRLYGTADDKKEYYESSAEFSRLLEELKRELGYGTPGIPAEDTELLDSIFKEADTLNKAIVADFEKYEQPREGDIMPVADPFSDQKERIITLLRQYREMEKGEIAFAHKEVNTATDETIFTILLSALIILILNLVINGLIARSITAPLHQLWETARQLGIGDFSRRVAISNRDEFGTLGAAFNIMADNIQKSHSDLESRIAESTAELRKAKAELEETMARKAALTGDAAPNPIQSDAEPAAPPQAVQAVPEARIEPASPEPAV
jgi:methyl-accepting chemotaxis protein